MKHKIILDTGVLGFAENKDEAKRIRTTELLPALARKEKVVIDCRNVKYATQSYIHALVGEALSIYGESLLDNVEFRKCTSQLKSVIELVVDYSLGGFPSDKTESSHENNLVVRKGQSSSSGRKVYRAVKEKNIQKSSPDRRHKQ